MRSGSVQGQTLSLCLVLAAVVLLSGVVADQSSVGAGLAIGLVIGAVNGFTIKAVLDRRAPILPTSIVRLALFSLLALGAARLSGGSVWPVVIGVGAAQLVLAAVGARQGLRA